MPTRKDIKSVGKQAAQEASRSLHDVAEEAGSNLRHFLHDRSEQAMDAYKTTEKKISDNPIPAVAIAVAGGFLLGLLLRR